PVADVRRIWSARSDADRTLGPLRVMPAVPGDFACGRHRSNRADQAATGLVWALARAQVDLAQRWVRGRGSDAGD
ncbi:MAG: hypothetical protein ACK58T_49640, partial [Phycisphaerae bacterium]